MIEFDLKTIAEGKMWNGSIEAANLVEKNDAPAIEINKDDFNIIWFDGFEFTNGIIEFDVKGKSEPPQGSFVGIAFRVIDETTYDSVYFRPFNFGALDPVRKSHAVQYVSHPEWHWYKLRQEKTGLYEQPLNSTLDGDMWFHARVIIKERQIQVFVNDEKEPVLEVAELSERRGGSVGIWCFGYGAIANLQITPEK